MVLNWTDNGISKDQRHSPIWSVAVEKCSEADEPAHCHLMVKKISHAKNITLKDYVKKTLENTHQIGI